MRINQSQARESNFELLRIVCMVGIIMHHYVIHGGVLLLGNTSNRIISQLFTIGGSLGVNCFALITGYFLPISHFSVRKVFKLIFEVWFYAWLWLVCAFIIHIDSISVISIFRSLLPVSSGAYWFATAFIGAYIMSPFMVSWLHHMQENPKGIKQLALLLLFLGLLLWGIPTIIPISSYYSGFAWLVYLFLFGSYLRIASPKVLSFRTCILVFLIFLSILWGLSIIFLILSNNIKEISGGINYFGNGKNNFFILMCSIGLFGIFRHVHIKYNPIINYIASTTFGIYLLHDGIFKLYMWHSVFRTQDYYSSHYMVLHLVVCICTIFFVGGVFDFVRKRVFEPILMKIFQYPISVLGLRFKFI